MFIKNQQGFIQIPILIAIIVGILAVGSTGYLIKQKVENQKAQLLEAVEIDKKELGPESNATPNKPIGTSKTIPQQSVSTNMPVPSPTLVPETKQDTGLLIAQCEAKRSVDYNDLVSKIDSILETTLQNTRSQVNARIATYETDYEYCNAQAGKSEYEAKLSELDKLFAKLDTLESDIKNRSGGFLMTAEQLSRLIASERSKLIGQIDTLQREISSLESSIRACKTNYDADVKTEKAYLESVVIKTQQEREKSLAEAKQIVDQEYLQCISQ